MPNMLCMYVSEIILTHKDSKFNIKISGEKKMKNYSYMMSFTCTTLPGHFPYSFIKLINRRKTSGVIQIPKLNSKFDNS